MIVESLAAQTGSHSQLATPWFRAESLACLIFYVYMAGEHVGQLALLVRSSQTEDTVLTLTGSQGQQWKRIEVDLSYYAGPYALSLVFDAERGFGYLGDIALDDVTVSRDMCNLPGDCCALCCC